MKKISLLFAFVGLILFVSCEKDVMSLTGTTWKNRTYFDDGFWILDEMSFTHSSATFTSTKKNGDPWSFTAPYTYDPNTKIFVVSNESPQPYPPEELGSIPDLEGKVNGNTMTFEIWESFDVIRQVKLKRQ